MAQGSSAQFCAKPGLALVGDLGDEASAAKDMGAAVVGHCFGKIGVRVRVLIIEAVRHALQRHTLWELLSRQD
jgi:nicotinamide mononucleotide (NMN) deamidase PncC